MIKKLFLLLALPLALASCRKARQQEMTVVRDCTGTYLRYQDKDYRVCNHAATDAFAEGTLVNVLIRTETDCNDDGFYCAMLHGYESEVRVIRITTSD